MRKIKILLLVTLGILAAATIYYAWYLPDEGTFTGKFLRLTPSFSIYYAAALFLSMGLKILKSPFPVFASLVLVIGFGYYAPYQMNASILRQVKDFERLDTALIDPIDLSNTIAVYDYGYRSHGDMCREICLELLFNKISKKVLIITDPLIAQGGDYSHEVTSYEIENRQDCVADYVVPWYWSEEEKIDLLSRIAAGECPVKRTARLSDADYIFSNEQIFHSTEFWDPVTSGPKKIRVQYIELLRNSGSSFERAYRYSRIFTKLFASPLGYGLIKDSDHGRTTYFLGLFIELFEINNFAPYRGSVVQSFKPQLEMIFGDSLKPVEAAEKGIRQLAKEASYGVGDGNAAGMTVLDYYIQDSWAKLELSSEDDIQLAIDALRNERIIELPAIGILINLAQRRGMVLPEELVQELADRIFREKNREPKTWEEVQAKNRNIKNLAIIISWLPYGRAASIYPQLVKIEGDADLRKDGYLALSRLGDAGPELALPRYIEMLSIYKIADFQDKKAKNDASNLAVAGLVGLCRMGRKALPAEDIVFTFVDLDKPGGYFSERALRALLAMGLIDKLKMKYEDNEEVWRQIQKTIYYDEQRAEKEGREVCR